MPPGSGFNGSRVTEGKIQEAPCRPRLLLGCYQKMNKDQEEGFLLPFFSGLLFSLLRSDCHPRLNGNTSRAFPKAWNSPHQSQVLRWRGEGGGSWWMGKDV